MLNAVEYIFVIYTSSPHIFHSFQGMVDIFFTVYDLDGTVGVAASSDVVDNILISPQLEAHNSSSTQVMTYTGNYSMLDLSFKLICRENHYTPQCVFCMETNNTKGHYTCDSSGKKVCLEGYQNITANCTECVPAEDCGECQRVHGCQQWFMCMCMPLYVCASMCAYVCVCVCVRVHAYMCVCVRVHATCVCVVHMT